MSSVITVQLPATLYTQLQSRAAQEHTDPIDMISRLVTADPSGFAGVIVKDPQIRSGRPVIAETGVTVRTIAGHYKLGLSPEEIAGQMELDLASVYVALAYYHLHRDEIETDIATNAEETVMRDFGASPHA